MLTKAVLTVALVLVPALAGAGALGDAERGAQLYRQCAACHMLGKDAQHRVGPHLNEIFGRRAGTAEGARYSAAMIEAGAEGLIWTEATLDAYIANPRSYVRGNRMSYRGLSDPQDRADLIAYLHGAGGDPETETTAGFEVAPEVLAIVGDVSYGEYLSSECTACHQASGADAGIPSITGWAEVDFVTAMHAYKAGARTHNVMQMMAGRLADDEIASLAAYFAGLE